MHKIVFFPKNRHCYLSPLSEKARFPPPLKCAYPSIYAIRSIASLPRLSFFDDGLHKAIVIRETRKNLRKTSGNARSAANSGTSVEKTHGTSNLPSSFCFLTTVPPRDTTSYAPQIRASSNTRRVRVKRGDRNRYNFRSARISTSQKIISLYLLARLCRYT